MSKRQRQTVLSGRRPRAPSSLGDDSGALLYRSPFAARALAILGLLLLSAAPTAAAQETATLEVDHGRLYGVGENLALGSVVGLEELEAGVLEEVFFTYNMVRSELEVDWLVDGEVVGHSALARGLRKRASHAVRTALPATVTVRFTGPSGQVQVTSAGAVVARDEAPPGGDVPSAPLAMQTMVQGDQRPTHLELRRPLDFETVSGLGSAAAIPGEPENAEARADLLRYPVQDGDPWATAVPHLVEIDGIHLGEGVRLVSALTASLAIVARDEPSRGTPVLSPGKASYDRLVLAGPLPVSVDVVSWFEEASRGRVDRRSGSVVILDRAGEELQRHNFIDSWPTRLSIDVTTGAWTLTLATEWIEFRSR